ncbi:MAG: thiolase domain-containing protein [Calditrichaeota bacterium]|nr:thiolase domain-containing protein [Calditrichota bacterium]
MREVAVIGVGMIKWGELWEKSIRDLCVEAALNCLDDAGVDRFDAITVGTMSSGLFVGQEHLSAMVADYLGNKHAGAMRVESACSSGGQAVRSAFLEVASGMADYVLAIGVEKMTDVDGEEATYALATAADQEWEVFHGVTFPGLYAMMARLHMERYGTTREQLAEVAVKNHHNGSLNPNAQFPFEVTREHVMSSTMVADPLRLFDCSPITDGAAAVLLAPLEEAKKLKKHAPVVISGVGNATDTIALAQRKDLLKLEAVNLSIERALKMASLKIEDVDFAEVHDCFTIAELMIMESMGIVKEGESGPAVMDGMTALDGKFPINPSGGLKAKGHPVGATGVAQICEVVTQLRGEAGKRQIKNARIGMTQNMGGSGASSVSHILEVK